MRHRDNAEATARNDAAIVDYRVRLLKDDAAGVIAADRSVVFDFDRARLGIDARVVALDGFTLRNDDAERFLLVVLDSRSEEHTSELQSLMRISYAVFCFKKKILQ